MKGCCMFFSPMCGFQSKRWGGGNVLCTCQCGCEHLKARDSCLLSLSIASLPYLLEKGSLTEPGVHPFGRTGCQQASEILLPLPPKPGVTNAVFSSILHGCRGSNLRFSLLIEPSFHPCFSCLHRSQNNASVSFTKNGNRKSEMSFVLMCSTAFSGFFFF